MSKINSRKLIDNWADERYDAHSNIYRLPNGVRVVESIKPGSRTIELSVILRGGSFFEQQIGVPNGTSHLLEHFIAGKPNKKYKTLEALDRASLGTLTTPCLMLNAKTTFKNMYIYGSTHKKGALKLFKAIYSRLNYPTENFAKYIEREKEIAISEVAMSKEEKDISMQLNNFLLGKEYPEITNPVAGTSKSIPKIKPTDLIKFKDTIYNPSTVVIAVQVGKPLTKALWQEIYNLASLFSTEPSGVDLKYEQREVQNKFDYYHFKDDLYRNDVYVAFSYLYREPLNIDYKEEVLWTLVNNLISEIGRIFVREEKGSIYWGSYISQYLINDIFSKGFKFSCRLEKLAEVIDDILVLLKDRIDEFLDSDYGKRWFVNQLSYFLFRGNQNFEGDYAENIGIDVLDERDFKHYLSKKEAVLRNLNISELKKFVKESLINTPTRIWFSSPFPKAKVYSEFEKTKTFKHFSSLSPKVA